MAALALAYVGSEIGAYVGWSLAANYAMSAGSIAVFEAIGAGAGSMVGSAIDRALFGSGTQSAQGPRLSDLSVQACTDGAPLPKAYGAVRLSGNVIWSTGLEERKKKKKSGGGGSGGGGGSSVTTYTYRTDAAIALCEGEIAGLRRIWADGKLIWQYSAGSMLEVSDSIRVYAGSETQDADPLIQAVEGAANAPAYRGTAYVVFENFELKNYGNRLPNFSFEVCTAGGTISGTPSDIGSIYNGSGYQVWAYNPITNQIWAIAWDGSWEYPSIKMYDADTGTLENTSDAIEEFHWGGVYHLLYDAFNEVMWIGGEDGDTGDQIACRLNITTGAVEVTIPDTGSRAPYFINVDPYTGEIWSGDYYYSKKVNRYQADGTFIATYTPTPTFQVGSMTFSSTHCYVGNYNWGDVHSIRKSDGTITHIKADALPYYRSIAYDSARDCLWALYDSGAHIGKFDLGTNAQVATYGTPFVADTPEYAESYANKLYNAENDWIMVADYGGAFALLSPDDGSVIYNSGDVNIYSMGSDRYVQVDGGCLYYVDTSYHARKICGGGCASTVPLDEVVSDLMSRAGLGAGQHDETDLQADAVRGYTLARPMTMRAALEPLQSVYRFDVIEEDGQIKAVKRGGSLAATLTTDDLGAAENPDGTLVAVTRNNETELPSEVCLTYADPDNDYQPATIYARRLTARHENKMNVSLPLVLQSQEAARAADIALNAAWWSGRHGYTFATTFERLRVSPSDLLSVPVYGVSQTMRVTGVDLGAPGLVVVSAVPDLASLYSSGAAASDGAGIGQSIGTAGNAVAVLLDCALLRGGDDHPGWYAGLYGAAAAWPGGVLYQSVDAGATYDELYAGSAGYAPTVGSVGGTLADHDGHAWDTVNSLAVTLITPGDTLESATEAAVLNGANTAAVGAHGRWEILQFKTATLNLDGSYTLSELLRGRLGTEWAAGLHAAGDAFVMLSESTVQDVEQTRSAIGAAWQYKAVTSGQALEAVSPTTLTYAGERLKPLSPVHLAGSRDGSGNLTLAWIRRDRIDAGWHDYADIPMSEASEAYEVDIFADGTYATVVRTIAAASATADYSAAEQTTDFGSPQASVYARVYQLSAVVGRGHPGQGTL